MTGADFFGGHDAVLCDLDGVVYAGTEAIDGAVPTLRELGRRGVPVVYVTNNASRSPESVADHLCGLGLEVTGDQVFGSAAAGVTLLNQELSRTGTRPTADATSSGGRPAPAKVLVVGSDYLRHLVSEAGHRVVATAAERPDAVIQGFDPSVSWADLAQAAYALNGGARWIATNADLTIPRAEGIAPGNGALIEAVSHATGTRPLAAGKPEPVLFRLAARAVGARQPLVVGDRLDTDILGGNRAGFTTALVLTGVDTEATAAAAPPDHRPTWIIPSLPTLLADSAVGATALLTQGKRSS
ncbi:HAD-IIA family hydrolase [Citricoccus sp.]|uniref:HAD-IIA family hydrolase n=1 Tax=Citricoccus sp. TaxID=1978372 RepID=UPI0028BF55D6|nr:HAD-IIA family hydrolase [Citricoccus sp.]